MNIYRITYIVGEGESKEAYITERTEAAARKTFKRMIEGREIADVELYETDAPATKEQEREALEKIKAISMTSRQTSRSSTSPGRTSSG